jgi:lipoprotein-anchoring transpeptidase ErfK/SrfK
MIRSYSWSLGTALAALMLGPAASTSAPARTAASPMPAAQPAAAIVRGDAAPRTATGTVRPAPVAAAPAVTDTAEIDALDPGEFVWHPERATSGSVEIVVSIPRQVAYVYRGGTLIAATTVSTGRPGHATPTGTFPILEKDRDHHSNRYNDAPMPFMQRLTWDGVALHAGVIPGHPASHGCVRLPLAFARNLYGITQVGAVVHIIDEAPSAETALATARGVGMAIATSAPVPMAGADSMTGAMR